MALTCLLTIFLVTAGGSALAETRVALVIGNSAYVNVQHLRNPAHDAALVGGSLRKAGFDVQVAFDLDSQAMRATVRSFALKARNADVALVYYAGHGMEMNGVNYLIPIDAQISSDTDVSLEAVALDQIMSVVHAKRMGVVILDACRNNPFAASMAMSGGGHRAVERGLARVEPVGDTLVVYAAKDGDVSEDGDGADSPFASALAHRLEQPGLEISLMLRRVRDDVLAATGNRQQPFTYGSIGGDPFYFVPAPSAQVDVAPHPAPASIAGQLVEVVGVDGRCLDASGGGDHPDKTPIILFTCRGTENQTWRYLHGELIGIGGKCIDAAGSGDHPDGTPVILYACHGGPNQLWTYADGQLVGAESRCLDAQGVGPWPDLTPVIIYSCHGGVNQRWTLLAR